MYQLYDSYSGVPILVGSFQTIDGARRAAQERDEASRGKFFPQLLKDGKIIPDWRY